jgi:hypothetical protein
VKSQVASVGAWIVGAVLTIGGFITFVAGVAQRAGTGMVLAFFGGIVSIGIGLIFLGLSDHWRPEKKA